MRNDAGSRRESLCVDRVGDLDRIEPVRTSGSMPRMPRRSIEPSRVAATLRSWISRFCATVATPAVRQPARPAKISSTGVAPLSSDAKISG